jgi:hypothetical protein
MGRMQAQHQACENHPCVIVLDLEGYGRTWLGSGEGSYGSAMGYRGYYVGGRVAGRRGWVFDEQSHLVNAVEGA